MGDESEIKRNLKRWQPFEARWRLPNPFLAHQPSLITLHLLSVVCLVLSACSTARRSNTPISRDTASLTVWQATGRIAVSGESAGGSGSFTWLQNGPDATVQMRGPVGIGSLRLQLSDRSIKVTAANGEEFIAEEAEQELTNRLGAAVPAQNLRYWLVGVAAPGDHQWSDAGDARVLNQQAWRIEYQRFEVAKGARLPMKIVAISGPAKVRIVIDKWKVE